MSEQAIRYLRENKGKYSSEELSKMLRGAGYAEDDIRASIREVFPEEASVVPPPPIPRAVQSFWNFRDKKIYTSAGQKWLDFFFGLFAPGLSFSILGFIMGNFDPYFDFGDMWGFFILAEISFLIYFWNRRRFIVWGLLAPMIFWPLILVLGISLLRFIF